MADEFVRLELGGITFSADDNKMPIAHVRLNVRRIAGEGHLTDLSLTFDVPDFQSLDEAVDRAQQKLLVFATALVAAAQRPLTKKKLLP